MKMFRTLAVLVVGMLGVVALPADAQYKVIAGAVKLSTTDNSIVQWPWIQEASRAGSACQPGELVIA